MKYLHESDRGREFTFKEAFLVPQNHSEEAIYLKCTKKEKAQFDLFITRVLFYEEKIRSGDRSAMSGLRDIGSEFRCFKNSLAEKYKLGGVVSRNSVDFTPRDHDVTGSLIPIVASNMNNVSGKRMAEIMARLGGYAAAPQDMSEQDLAKLVTYMRSRDSFYRTPVYLTKRAKVFDFKNYIYKHDLDAAVIVDDDGYFEGIVTKKDIDEKDGGLPIDSFIKRRVRTAKVGISPNRALSILRENPQEILPILDDERRVIGVLSRRSVAASLKYKANIDEDNGGLGTLVTIGALNKNPIERVKALIDLGIRGIILDTAHLDQGAQPYINIEKVKSLIEQSGKKIFLVVGNVVTGSATREAISAGADIVKVGIGPGAMCITRMETGVGRPQLNAILECAEVANLYGGHVWSDGGIQYPRDLALALACGASQVMIGTMFAGSYESPPDIKFDKEGRPYKNNYGMASGRAVSNRGPHDKIMNILGNRIEGISSGVVYLGTRPSILSKVHWLINGLTSTATYTGATNMDDFYQLAVVGLQGPAGYEEGSAKQVT